MIPVAWRSRRERKCLLFGNVIAVREIILKMRFLKATIKQLYPAINEATRGSEWGAEKIGKQRQTARGGQKRAMEKRRGGQASNEEGRGSNRGTDRSQDVI